MQNLEEIFCRLKEHVIQLPRDKCQFFQEAVEYLENMVDAQGICTLLKKIQVITEALPPQNYAHS